RYFFGVPTSAAFDVGAVYRDATETDERFLVRLPKASFPTGAFMIAELTAGDGLPPGGGALTKVSGTGDGTITWNQAIFDGLHFAKAGANDPAEAVLNL